MKVFHKLRETLRPGQSVEGVSFEELRKLRTEARRCEFGKDYNKLGWDHWNTGGCSVVANELDAIYGWEYDGGCYVVEGGSHILHNWNILPDGRILDVTVDQFKEGDDIRITSGDDPRYLGECDCFGQIGTKEDHGQFEPRNERGAWQDN